MHSAAVRLGPPEVQLLAGGGAVLHGEGDAVGTPVEVVVGSGASDSVAVLAPALVRGRRYALSRGGGVLADSGSGTKVSGREHLLEEPVGAAREALLKFELAQHF